MVAARNTNDDRKEAGGGHQQWGMGDDVMTLTAKNLLGMLMLVTVHSVDEATDSSLSSRPVSTMRLDDDGVLLGCFWLHLCHAPGELVCGRTRSAGVWDSRECYIDAKTSKTSNLVASVICSPVHFYESVP